MTDKLQTAKIRMVRARLLTWYEDAGRRFPWRKPQEPLFRQVITEFLLQRTRATTVARHYSSFFRRYDSWTAIANASRFEFQKDLKPFGLWKQRSARLKALAEAVLSMGGRLPSDRLGLQDLPGMGQYMVNATMLLNGTEAAPLLDVNMARVLERCFGPRKLADIRYDPFLQSLAWNVVAGPNAKKLNWAILDLAASHCGISRRYCISCPLQSVCRAHIRNSAQRQHHTFTAPDVSTSPAGDERVGRKRRRKVA